MTALDDQGGARSADFGSVHGVGPDEGSPPRRGTRWLVVAVVVAVVVAGGALVGLDDDVVETAPSGSADAPSPLFGEVEQVVPTSLPAGWARCGGARSDRPDATDAMWAQTFGPIAEGECRPTVKVTQVPPDAQVDLPPSIEDGKVGGADDGPDAIKWTDEASGSFGLFTWARGQGLMLEACCGPDAAEQLDELAVAALASTRERAPGACISPESDLDREDEVDNYFGSQGRMYASNGCPLRRDIATMPTNGPEDHCWPDATSLVVGTPVGASYETSERRVFTRDVDGVYTGGVPDPRLDLDATLPLTAVDTGYSKDGRNLWIDEATDEVAYLVAADHVEAWPRDRKDHACA